MSEQGVVFQGKCWEVGVSCCIGYHRTAQQKPSYSLWFPAYCH